MSKKIFNIPSLRRGYREKEFSVSEIIDETIREIGSKDSALNAFLTLNTDEAKERARALDSMDQSEFPLYGIPVAVKDVIVTKGLRTTAGSKILENYIPPYDATVVRAIKEAGGIIIGKTNCDEFGMGASGEYSAYGPTKNPKNLAKVPGGSSSGSAASVAAGFVPCALGSDTGGSVRQPASFCGVVGLKPTYGRVSRYGLISLASSFDQIGLFATSVADCAFLFDIIAFHDPLDSTSSQKIFKKTFDGLSHDIKGLKVGVPVEYLPDSLDPDIRRCVEYGVAQCKEMGCEVQTVSLPHLEFALPAYYIILPSEASSNLGRYDGVRYGRDRSHFGREVKRRIMIGTAALSRGYVDAYYKQAQRVRTLIKKDFDRVFKSVDCLIGPVAPSTAFGFGEKISDPVAMYLSDIFTVSVNVAGLPGLSIPMGEKEGLPIGLQIIGPAFSEEECLRFGHHLVRKTGAVL